MRILGKPGYELGIVRTLPMIILVNIGIAVVLYMAGQGTFLDDMLSSECIGLSIYGFACAAMRLSPSAAWFLWSLPLTLLAGTVAGITLVALIDGAAIQGLGQGEGSIPWRSLSFGLFFGGLFSYLFFLRGKAAHIEAEIQQEKAKNLSIEKQMAEAHLKTLQAQIEPHFLFNTLANVQSLIDLDPPRAHRMLDSFIRYLRATLARTRDEASTLGAECELLEAYLSILAIRMGERLRYSINVAEPLRGQPLPPMLMQPLVENAIKHGLEPKVEGGTLRVEADVDGLTLRLTVSDDGFGFQGGSGVGLSNVRERLNVLYGAAARLLIEDSLSSGTRVTIELPLARPKEKKFDTFRDSVSTGAAAGASSSQPDLL